MNILLTNDDGIHAEGINTLYDVLSKQYNVYIIAPDRERSACSNAITVRNKLTVKKIAHNKFTTSGFPADCVNIGLHGDLIPDVALIISGINHGPNIGDDLFFSGTVAGARSAYIFGKTGIALSINTVNHNPSKYFYNASTYLINFLNELDFFQKPGTEAENNPLLFNINYPNLPDEEIKGTKYTFVGRRKYKDTYIKSNIIDSEMTLELDGTVKSVFIEGSDVTELEKGYISITPLMLNCTDYPLLKKQQELENVRC